MSSDRTCSVIENGEPCPKPVVARGWCRTHYQRWHSHGDPLHISIRRPGGKCLVVDDTEPCGRDAVSRGWCQRHYLRWRKHGDPLITGHVAKDFIRELLEMEPTDECILWPAATFSDGYGMVNVGGTPTRATRHILALFKGDPPDPSMEACHAPHDVCGNVLCINPRHLRWGSHRSNMLDKEQDGTNHKGEQHANSKVTAEEVLAIRVDGRTCAEIALDYGLSKQHVNEIQNRKVWKHLKDPSDV